MPREVTADTPITAAETAFNVSVIQEQQKALGNAPLTEDQLVQIAGGNDPALQEVVRKQIQADKAKVAAAFPITSNVALVLGGVVLVGMVGGLAYYALKEDK